MAVGRAQNQIRFDDAAGLLGDRLPVGSVYHLLAGEGHRLFPDDYFADLFTDSVKGRPTIPARVVATVMLLQAHEGLSDREAVERLAFDLRWKAAAGLAVDAGAFHPTVLLGMRNRLRASLRPRRLHEDVRAVVRAAGLLRGRKRVLDSTPLYDAVATQDTVTQLRAAIRKLLALADAHDAVLAAAVRSVLARDDDHATVGKPPCDWDDRAARDALVDALVRDCLAALGVLHGRELSGPLAEAGELLALVAGQDVEPAGDSRFRIARKVARDRVISTVDTQARHGHKSRNRTFDGYKAHLAVDPDDELIDEVAVTSANTPDRDAVDDLLPDTDDHDNDDGGDDPPAPAGHPGHVTLVMRVYEGGSVKAAMDARHRFSISDVIGILGDIADALSYLHVEKGIVHRDVKPGNVLLDRDRRTGYLSDFGSAARIDSGVGTAAAIRSTPLYQAPEVSRTGRFGPPADIYALGLAAFEMLNGLFPYDSLNPADIDKRVNSGRRALPDRSLAPAAFALCVPTRLVRLIRRMLDAHPGKRPPSATETLRNLRSLQCVDWCRALGDDLSGAWSSRWPPRRRQEQQIEFRVSSTVLRGGVNRGSRRLVADYRSTTS
jgi:hypothetical protein